MVFATFFPPLLLSKILRGPSTTSERHMKIGSSGVRVKALLGTSPKEKTWTQRWKKKFQCSGMHHLDSIFLPFLSHSHPLSQALFQTGIPVFLPSLPAKKVFGLLFSCKGLVCSHNNKTGLESFPVPKHTDRQEQHSLQQMPHKRCGMILLDEPLLKKNKNRIDREA